MLLGVVGGIYLAMNHPDIANTIFEGFLVLADRVITYLQSILAGA